MLMQFSGMGTLAPVLTTLEARALASQSQFNGGIQYGQPQWQLDVTNWYNIVLASIQAMYVNTAIGTSDLDLRQFDVMPINGQEQKLCNSQVGTSSHSTSSQEQPRCHRRVST
jgi:hypothetical protein